MIFLIWILSSLASVIVVVKDPVYYRLLGVAPDASQEVIHNYHLRLVDRYKTVRFVEALHPKLADLSGIIQTVGRILKDPLERSGYDLRGPVDPVNLMAFNQILLDDLVIRILQRHIDFPRITFRPVGVEEPFYALYAAHRTNELGVFMAALRSLQGSPWAWLIAEHLTEMDTVYGDVDAFVKVLPYPQLTLDLGELRLFLLAILRRYGPYCQMDRLYTVYDRIGEVAGWLSTNQGAAAFAWAHHMELTAELFYVLTRNDPWLSHQAMQRLLFYKGDS